MCLFFSYASQFCNYFLNGVRRPKTDGSEIIQDQHWGTLALGQNYARRLNISTKTGYYSFIRSRFGDNVVIILSNNSARGWGTILILQLWIRGEY